MAAINLLLNYFPTGNNFPASELWIFNFSLIVLITHGEQKKFFCSIILNYLNACGFSDIGFVFNMRFINAPVLAVVILLFQAKAFIFWFKTRSSAGLLALEFYLSSF